MSEAQREMTLDEWVGKLPEIHKARREYEEIKNRFALPVDLLLFCPQCGEQHIDEAKPDVCEACGGSEDQFPRDPETFVCVCKVFIAWLNPPHKSHRCTSCNHVWRPADVPKNGVAAIKTKGERDGDIKPLLRKGIVYTLEEIQLAVCYATEEDIDSKADMLLKIGALARTALKQIEGEPS